MTIPPCPACGGVKRPRQYVCAGCWYTMPTAARRALNRRDNLAIRRLQELLDQLKNDVPVHRIEITP